MPEDGCLRGHLLQLEKEVWSSGRIRVAKASVAGGGKRQMKKLVADLRPIQAGAPAMCCGKSLETGQLERVSAKSDRRLPGLVKASEKLGSVGALGFDTRHFSAGGWLCSHLAKVVLPTCRGPVNATMGKRIDQPIWGKRACA